MDELMKVLGEEPVNNILTVPKNGVLRMLGRPPIVVVGGAQVSRDMRVIIRGGTGKTFMFPNTITAVGNCAFDNKLVSSVRFNEGLKTLEENCFQCSGIRRLTLSSGIEFIGKCAFCKCESLEYADLSAAHSLKAIGGRAFDSCEALRKVLLNDGLETICGSCFTVSGLEEVSIPGSVRSIESCAFSDS